MTPAGVEWEVRASSDSCYFYLPIGTDSTKLGKFELYLTNVYGTEPVEIDIGIQLEADKFDMPIWKRDEECSFYQFMKGFLTVGDRTSIGRGRGHQWLWRR